MHESYLVQAIVVLLEVWQSVLFEFRRYLRTGEQGELEALGEVEAVDKLKPPAARTTGRTAHKQCQISGPVPIPTPSSVLRIRRLLSASTIPSTDSDHTPIPLQLRPMNTLHGTRKADH